MQFLTHLAVKEGVSASTQNQALNAILYLYRHIINCYLDPKFWERVVLKLRFGISFPLRR